MTTDATLLSAWRNGDDAAGRTLIERHMPRLYRFFASRIEAEADDLCQQTLADCVKNRDKIEDDAEGRNFRAYLFTIARRRLLKYYRTRRRAAARFDPLEQ
ncbi:MAG: sigma-70 family RNA polymerase sigma factor, partial [Myxococcota bacterium]